ncbi:PIN domain-containing protein [Patescibacteria group bacterium]|nr:PIN domain-containing protein [Patescibacteria group bacterium]MBU4512813.1 PIN domain-containing protein [Patescibacteria group bacterium]MCG2693216.1 PIN domain-containing protein [Candidatus Parcubacteria bacterium]
MPKAKQTIYLETSVISAYFDFWKKSPLQKRETRKFWKIVLPDYEPVTSTLTIIELERARREWRNEYLKLIQNIRILNFSPKVSRLAERYIKERIIPKSKADDAGHLAIAVTHEIDFFLTWNMQHFLRPNKMKQIINFNRTNSLYIPTLVNPNDFLE